MIVLPALEIEINIYLDMILCNIYNFPVKLVLLLSAIHGS
jgi:hypothetical protein